MLKKADILTLDWNETGMECISVPVLMQMKLTAGFGLDLRLGPFLDWDKNMDVDKLKLKRK